ncbi:MULTISPECIES: SDR family oxidoreductase [Streptomyces]|uniref:SDR family oxidoreductase n=1 Tax=Streptomyces TaxID=1883 RepID=UPI000B8D3FA2|nr:SDR family oxidoreductase [Streptomyces sp. 11-1-2]ASQ92973.1 short-chain dehydrogenase/reductase [Streptomyces sp. 11-1-2]
MAKTWFITGTSRGFGREWALAALDRGDRVVATARDTATLAPLTSRYGDAVLPIRLDVTDRTAVEGAVARAVEHFGGLDVVVNNAGYGLFGMVEEVTEADARAQLETNLFGALWVTRAVLPQLRAQGHGRILQVSSIGGVFALPGLGLYHASKFALEGLTESLAAEVAGFGIKVTLVEPAGYATDWAGSSSAHAERLPAYDDFRATMHRAAAVRQDPAATRKAILTLADADEPPLRFFLGTGPLDLMRQVYPARLAEWERWEAVSTGIAGG